MLLEYDQVRTRISSGIVGESIVWQTQSRHKVCAFHKLHPHKRRGSVHNALRGDKRYKTSLAYLVESLQEEIIVNRLCRLTVGDLLAHRIRRVCNRKIPERNI